MGLRAGELGEGVRFQRPPRRSGDSVAEGVRAQPIGDALDNEAMEAGVAVVVSAKAAAQ